MKKNMGFVDRVIRILIAITLTTLYLTGIITGLLGIALIVLSVVFAFTSLVSVCPLYLPFGINTRSRLHKQILKP